MAFTESLNCPIAIPKDLILTPHRRDSLVIARRTIFNPDSATKKTICNGQCGARASFPASGAILSGMRIPLAWIAVAVAFRGVERPNPDAQLRCRAPGPRLGYMRIPADADAGLCTMEGIHRGSRIQWAGIQLILGWEAQTN